VISVSPAATAVTSPVSDAVATSGLPDANSKTRSSTAFPSASRAVAVTGTDSPTAIEESVAVNSTSAIAGGPWRSLPSSPQATTSALAAASTIV
jgi:hypothetical protein